MKKIYKLGYLFLIIIFLGCKSGTEGEIDLVKNSISYHVNLAQHKIIRFPLDSISSPDIRSLAVYNDGLKKYFVYFNRNSNIIYFYDYSNNIVEFTILLNEEGENEVGANIQGLYIHNLDSIYLFDDYRILQINKGGEITKRYGLNDKHSSRLTFTLESGTKNNVFKSRDEMYVGISSELDPFLPESFKIPNQVLLRLNLNSMDYSTYFDFPEVYSERMFSPNFSNVYFTFNPARDVFLFSFPADPKVYVKNFGGINQSVFAGTDYPSKLEDIRAADSPEGFMVYTKNYLTSTSYGPIYYDNYRKVYYRIVEHPISESEFYDKEWMKAGSIIILDDELNIIGETKFEKDVNRLGIIDESGLLIPVLCPDNSEEYLCLGVYVLTSND